MLAEEARQHPQRVALVFDERTLTYGELAADARSLAAALARRGVGKGSLVALLLSNRHEMAVAYFALMYLGAVAVPINTAFKGEGLAYYFQQSGATTALIEAVLLSRVDEAPGSRDHLQRVIVVGGETVPPGAERFADLLAEGGEVTPAAIGPGDPWAILYTSGTTGPSKGVVLPAQWLATTSAEVCASLNVTEETVNYTFAPLFHANALVYGITSAILAGARCVVRARFPREALLADWRRTGATHTSLPPFVIHGLLAQPPQPDDAHNPVRIVTTMSLGERDWLAFEQRFGLSVRVGYGITEAGMICTCGRGKMGSAGKPSDRFELRIVDAEDQPLPPGAVGEIVVRPRRPFEMMLGYHRMPEATVAAFRNLWLHTGDAGYLDGDGYLFFTDRLKDMIKRRGENISSFEVERVLYAFPGVAAAAVVPCRLPGSIEEEVRAFIVPKPGADIAPDALIAHCARHLAHFQVPRFIDLRQELPHNAVGKLEKFKLSTLPLDEQTYDRKQSGIRLER